MVKLDSKDYPECVVVQVLIQGFEDPRGVGTLFVRLSSTGV
jgi:hypothetical protein